MEGLIMEIYNFNRDIKTNKKIGSNKKFDTEKESNIINESNNINAIKEFNAINEINTLKEFNENREITTNKKEIESILLEKVVTVEPLRDNVPAQEDLKRLLNRTSLTRTLSEGNKITFYNLEIIFEIMNTLAKDREIKWKYHYDAIIDKNARYVLRINIKSFFNKLINKFKELSYECCFDENKSYDVVRLIKHKDYCLGNFNTRFLREDQSEKKYINSSCVYIDIAELQNLGVNISDLLVDNS